MIDRILVEMEAGKEETSDLLPILMVLRDLAPVLSTLNLNAMSKQDRESALARAVVYHAQETIETKLFSDDFKQGLKQALVGGRCLLVLDGLDEVPADLRPLIREALNAVLSNHCIQRMIVTCRIRSYEGDARLAGFEGFTLAPFDKEKITAFIDRWYDAAAAIGRVSPNRIEEKKRELTDASLSGGLQELASNPMLLTTMALIHQRDIGLPSQKVALYKLAVDVLLNRWPKDKLKNAAVSLSESSKLLTIMERLAFATFFPKDFPPWSAPLPAEISRSSAIRARK